MVNRILIEKALLALSRDELVVYPTDTLYGLGADALSDEAIMHLFEAKGRDFLNPVSVAVSDRDMLKAIAYVNEFESDFIDRFLPGPVTVLLKPRSIVPASLMAGTKKIGVRIPADKTALALIEAFDSPITATSANRSGDPDPKTVQDCRVACSVVIDDGKRTGTSSTVIDLTNCDIIRQGACFDDICEFVAKNR